MTGFSFQYLDFVQLQGEWKHSHYVAYFLPLLNPIDDAHGWEPPESRQANGDVDNGISINLIWPTIWSSFTRTSLITWRTCYLLPLIHRRLFERIICNISVCIYYPKSCFWLANSRESWTFCLFIKFKNGFYNRCSVFVCCSLFIHDAWRTCCCTWDDIQIVSRTSPELEF